MLIEFDGKLYQGKLVLSPYETPAPTPEPEPTGIDVPASLVNAPAFIDGPPKGWPIVSKTFFEQYPEGPLETLPSPWYPSFSHNANTLNGANEDEVYVTPTVKARGITFNPFSVKLIDGVKWLGITARAGTDAELPKMEGKKVLSGVMSSSSELLYGYVEAEQLLPIFKGSWFANWMMGPSWLPEFDLVEHLSTPYGSKKWFSNIHWDDGGHKATGGEYNLPGSVTVRHKVAGLWHPNFLAVYFNGAKVFEKANPTPGLRAKMHWVINLAVGGPASTWATPVDLKALPQTAYVRALIQAQAPF